MGKIFKIDFDISDYKDILPDINEYLKHDEVLNFDQYTKGNIDNCIWKRYRPSLEESLSPQYQDREAKRVLKTGVWACISEELFFIPENYYFALQYGKTGGDDLQFRLKRLKHTYFKIRARNNPACMGTYTVKNRQDGETTMSIIDAFWEMLEMEDGQIGIQSKTRDDAKNPCWKTAQTLWQNLPVWFKNYICSDFASGTHIEETMKFMRSVDETKGISARNVLMAYYPAVFNAMDGKNNMKKCILDEVLKWVECSFGDTLTNYKKFIMPGMERRGMFDIFSSPADKDCKSYREGYELWKQSDPKEITANGTTASRLHRYYSNPLEGIQGAYDKFGDADPNRIYDHIMQERKNTQKDKLMGEIRGFPLNEEEMWGSLDGGDFWSNQKGINARKIYLIGSRFKNSETKEPTTMYGNLDWEDGIVDSKVVWRLSDKSAFDEISARFCISYMPQNPVDLKYAGNIPIPPSYIQSTIGIDSVDKRYGQKGNSNLAMVAWQFRDAFQSGINKCPTLIYCNRPKPIEIAYEDAIKAALFTRSMVQVESLNSKIVDYFEDRGYLDWMLSKIGHPKNSLVKGDAPSGKSAFMDEIIGLLDAATNVPLDENDPDKLSLNWFTELLEDMSNFNPKDTHKNDLSMAWGQALLGSAKILFKKIREKSQLNNNVMSYLLD